MRFAVPDHHQMKMGIHCVCAMWVGYSMAKGVCSIVPIVGGGGGDNAAEKSVDRQQLPEHVPLFTQSHYAGQIYHT